MRFICNETLNFKNMTLCVACSVGDVFKWVGALFIVTVNLVMVTLLSTCKRHLTDKYCEVGDNKSSSNSHGLQVFKIT